MAGFYRRNYQTLSRYQEFLCNERLQSYLRLALQDKLEAFRRRIRRRGDLLEAFRLRLLEFRQSHLKSLLEIICELYHNRRRSGNHSQQKNRARSATSAVSLDSRDSLTDKPLQNEAAFERGLPIR